MGMVLMGVYAQESKDLGITRHMTLPLRTLGYYWPKSDAIFRLLLLPKKNS